MHSPFKKEIILKLFLYRSDKTNKTKCERLFMEKRVKLDVVLVSGQRKSALGKVYRRIFTPERKAPRY